MKYIRGWKLVRKSKKGSKKHIILIYCIIFLHFALKLSYPTANAYRSL